jgi:hypothetical protein
MKSETTQKNNMPDKGAHDIENFFGVQPWIFFHEEQPSQNRRGSAACLGPPAPPTIGPFFLTGLQQ